MTKRDDFTRVQEIVKPFLGVGEAIADTKPGIVSVWLGGLTIRQPVLSLFIREYEQIGQRAILGDTAPSDDRMYQPSRPGAWVTASAFQSFRELGPIRFKAGGPIEQVSVQFRLGWYPVSDQGAKDYGLGFEALRYHDDTGEQVNLKVEPYVFDSYSGGGTRKITDFLKDQGFESKEIGGPFDRQCELLGRCLQIAQGADSVQ